MPTFITPAGEEIDLRRGVDYIGVNCSFVIHDGDGKILLQKRSQKCRDEQGCWDIGGGAIEFGEALDETVKREVYEELGAEAQDIKFLTMYDAHRQLADGTPTHWIANIWAVQVDPASVRIGEPEKIDEIAWFHQDELPNPLHSQFWKSYQVALDQGIVR